MPPRSSARQAARRSASASAEPSTAKRSARSKRQTSTSKNIPLNTVQEHDQFEVPDDNLEIVLPTTTQDVSASQDFGHRGTEENPDQMQVEELNHDHTDLSGATAVNHSIEVSAFPQHFAADMPGQLPQLDRAACEVISTILSTVNDARYVSRAVADLENDPRFQRYETQLYQMSEWYGPTQCTMRCRLIDTDMILRGLFNIASSDELPPGNWRPDPIFSRANLAMVAICLLKMSLSDPISASELVFLDRHLAELSLLELSGFTEERFAKDGPLRDALCNFFLKLRTQCLIANLRWSSDDHRSVSDHITEMFLTQNTENARALLTPAAERVSEKLSDEIMNYAQSIDEATKGIDGQTTVAEHLAQIYTWEDFCWSLVQVLTHCDSVWKGALTRINAETVADRLGSRILRSQETQPRSSLGLRFSRQLVEQAQKAGDALNNQFAVEEPTVSALPSRLNYKGSSNGRRISPIHYSDAESNVENFIPRQPNMAGGTDLLNSSASGPSTQSASQDIGFVAVAGPGHDRQEDIRREHNRGQLQQRKRPLEQSPEDSPPRKRHNYEAPMDESYHQVQSPLADPGDDEFEPRNPIDDELPPDTQLSDVRLAAKRTTMEQSAQKQQRSRATWTSQEENRIIQMIGEYGPKYALIKKKDDQSQAILSERSAEDIRHKCRNIKFTYLKAKYPLPPNFEFVNIDRKFREELGRLGVSYTQPKVRNPTAKSRKEASQEDEDVQ